MSGLRRVMLISPVGTIGGGEEVLLALVQHLPAVGYAAELACLRPGPLAAAARAAGSPFVAEGKPHRMRQLGQVRASRQWLTGLVRERQPAIVHCNHMAHLYGHGPARAGGVPEVWSIYDYPHKLDWADHLCRLVPADHVIFSTPFIASGYPIVAKRYPNSLVSPSAPELPNTSGTDLDELRRRLDLPINGPVFLTAARMQRHKGHLILLTAMRTVLDAWPSTTFVVTGEATDPAQAAYLLEVKSSAESIGVARAVRFVGRVGDNDLLGLYALATALVHPATSEGYGLSLVNAMRAGVPVIAADAEGPREVLADGALGRLVPRGDPMALAVAMLDIVAHRPADLDRIAALARARFAPATMATAVGKVYDRVLRKNQGRA